MISVDALMLAGLLQCSGSNVQKAKCFFLVTSPEMEPYISLKDKDLRTALNFLVTISTVIEEMTQDMLKSSNINVDYSKYLKKVERHSEIYDEIYEDFRDHLFGEFANKSTRAEFKERLASEGWKYFDANKLNGMFAEESGKLDTAQREEHL